MALRHNGVYFMNKISSDPLPLTASSQPHENIGESERTSLDSPHTPLLSERSSPQFTPLLSASATQPNIVPTPDVETRQTGTHTLRAELTQSTQARIGSEPRHTSQLVAAKEPGLDLISPPKPRELPQPQPQPSIVLPEEYKRPKKVPSSPKKITTRTQEFLPEFQPCCDTRPRGKRPGTIEGDKLIASEDAWLASHAQQYPYPTFSGVHKCFNNAEAYTAGWLAHKDMVVRARFETCDYKGQYDASSIYGFPYKWGKSTNMEAVTHTILGPLMQKYSIGAFKTLDAFDFSIEHLSLYERRLGLMTLSGELKDRTVRTIVDNLADREKDVRSVALQAQPAAASASSSSFAPPSPWYKSRMTQTAYRRANQTIVLMPFYGVSVGTGHSVVSTRFAYLNLTFWSHYRVFPHIGVVVGTEEDLNFVTSPTCGLPWAQVVSVVGHIAMPKNMGVAAGMAAAQKFRSGQWAQYNFMYWTESDQVLVMRDTAVEPLYALVEDSAHLVAPHRLLPFPRSSDFDPSLAHALKTKGGNDKELAANDATLLHAVVPSSPTKAAATAAAAAATAAGVGGSGSGGEMAAAVPLEDSSCCFDPGDCTRRDHWSHFSDTSKVCMIRFHDTMGVVNGEANIFHHTWRTCAFSETRVECPRAY